MSDWQSEAAALLAEARGRTRSLFGDLPGQVLREQSVSFLGPAVWDLAHIAVFEEVWLLRSLDGRPHRRPELLGLYDPFEQPRHVREKLPLLAPDEAWQLLDEVRRDALDLLEQLPADDPRPLLADGFVYRMVAQHECQHQETVLQALDLVGKSTPAVDPSAAPAARPRSVDERARVEVAGGEYAIGARGAVRPYDNERAVHPVVLRGFALDRYPVTNGRWERFVEEGCYRRPELWSEAGRAWLERTGATAPQGWCEGEGGGAVERFGERIRRDPLEPVQHVSCHEAEAFARWEGGRLPTEAEWEVAASHDPATGRMRRFPWGDDLPRAGQANLAWDRGGPAPVGSLPDGAAACGAEQMLGDVYQWTASSFDPYPGFSAFPYREYSEVFFGRGYRVLRGASWAGGPLLARNTYRNWDLPERRQLFAGLRLAWDRT